ncbi:MAG: hypothetical protein KGK17_00840, partial [Betaproteobacteria bacterium]|nr:hypothetical protein [Betaproteobacteria bacterium]
WCSTVSYSAELSSGMDSMFGAGTAQSRQGPACYASQMACESARQSAMNGVSSTPCIQQGGPSGALQGSQGVPTGLTPMQGAMVGAAAGVAATVVDAIGDSIVKAILGDPVAEKKAALQKQEEQRQAALKAAEEQRQAAENQRQKELAFANQKTELLQDMNGVQQTLGIASDTTGFPQLHQQVPFPQGWTDTPWLDQMQRDLSANEPPPPVATSYPQPKNPLPPPKANKSAAQKPSPTQSATSSSEVDLGGKQGIVDPADLKKHNPNNNGYLPLARSVPSPQPPAEPWYKNIEDSLTNSPGNIPGAPQPVAITGVRG